ncbi:DUF2860 family protein [Photobacterium sp. OFAV2-7]|uniref:DUF2860 family protein n=1 Tax=Photobacterium sp. OFAV2-7 TaxID=2917748 RepID=UPI001EF704FD|nr:DUF2860 family protein [Photobacterium sp. OFAV2-7]MCG7584321.1 DUF2860 domain-containing protein [Photobacterium sp. OFAV2-7]
MKKHYLLALLIAAAYPAFAELGPQGISGSISVLVEQHGQESNFNTNLATKSGSLNTSGESDMETVVFPLGEIKYTFGEQSNQQVFLGTSREDITTGLIALELGY